MGDSQKTIDSRFSGRVEIRCPPALPRAIQEAAQRQMMTPTEYVRRSIIDRLVADGVALETRVA